MSLDAGLTIHAIAQRLRISDRTLRNHLSAIYEKLGVSSRLELWDYAQKNNMARDASDTRQTIPGD
jgi:DNA-binding NarL/FixJ family response regulator